MLVEDGLRQERLRRRPIETPPHARPSRAMVTVAGASMERRERPHLPGFRKTRPGSPAPEYPHGESNPGFRTENPTSWATRRWGRCTSGSSSVGRGVKQT
jgi:hypothetical protein